MKAATFKSGHVKLALKVGLSSRENNNSQGFFAIC